MPKPCQVSSHPVSYIIDGYALDQKWFVITDDGAVRRQAVKNGAHFVPLDLFAVLRTDFHCLQESPKEAA